MPIHPLTGVGLRRAPARIIGLYVTFGLLWLWLSDWTLTRFSDVGGRVQFTVFLAVTAVLLYWVVRRELRRAQRSENLLRAVVEGTTDAVFVKDRDGRYLLANEAAARFMGRSIEEVIGRTDREIFEATDAERLIANDRSVMARGAVVTLEETLTSGGLHRTYHATKAPYRDAKGTVFGLVGVARDITDRKATEDALRVSEERYRKLTDAVPQIVWTAGPDGAIIHVNSKATEYTGVEAGNLSGWSWDRVVHPDDLDHAVTEWKRALGDGAPRPFEMRIRQADGACRWHIVRQRPIHDATGRIVSWVGTCTDIDDLKQAEKALRETETRLHEAQRIARMGSWTWEPPTNRVWWSDAEFELFGVDPLTVSPSFGAFLALLHPDDRVIAIARVESMMSGADEFANDLRIVRPDGQSMWINSRARATRDAGGNVVRVEGTDQDVTARRLAELAAQESEKRLQAAVEVAGLGVIVVDYDQETTELSPQAAEQFGFTPGISVSRTELHSRFHPDDMADLERLTATALFPGGTGYFDLEHRVVRPDGTTRWLNVRKQVSFADDRPHRAVVVTADVTDRRIAEEALRSSEARYRLMFEANPNPMWVYDIDSLRFLAVNDAAVQVYGYSREEFLAMTIRDIRPPEDLLRLESAIAGLTPGLAQSSLWRHLRKDGTLFYVDAFSHNLPDGGGRSRLVLVLDVTERLRAEEARDELLARLQLHIDRMPIAYILFDADIRYAEWNPASEKIFGYTRDEIIGQPMETLVYPEDRVRVEKISHRLRAGEVTAQSINRNVTKDGRVIICEWHNTPLFAPNGAFLGILSMTQDITDRVRAEESLRESERRLRLALEAAGAIAFMWDIKNDAVTRYFSTESALPVTAEGVVTLNEVRARIHPDDLPGFDSHLSACLAEGTDYHNEYRIVRPDGTTACLEEYGYLDRAPDGSPLRLLGMSIDVTERVAASEALRQSEDRLREAARVAGFGVFEHDHLAESLFWSTRIRDLYGLDAEAPADLNTYLEMVHPEDRAAIEAAVAEAHNPAGEGRFDVRHRLIRPNDGRIRWLATQSQTWFAGHGPDRRLIRTVGATVDVTEAVEAAEALRESERRFRQLVDVLPESLFVDVGGRITYCNPAFVRLMGAANADELIGLSPFDVAHSDYHHAIRARASVVNGFHPISTEMRVVRRDGRAVPVYAVATGIHESGQHAVLVVLSDLTQRERATELLRIVLGSVSDAILTIDQRGIVKSANPAALGQFGYAEDELVGENVSLLMPEPYREEHDGYLADYIRTGLAKVIGIGREVECRRRDGSRFPAELTVTEFSLEGERHFTGVLRDITERRRLQSQFIQAQKMEAVGRLAGGVAHDFNNLLTIINGYCELLLMSDLPVGDQRRESVASIRDAGERAARLTEQLLAFSRSAIIEPKVIDLNELVSDSAKLLRRLIGEDIILAVITVPMPIWVKADPSQLEQVIMNLVVNARDAMPTGGRLTIETSTLAPADVDRSWFACLTVSDTGHGMTDEVKGKIFEPFFTTKGVGKGTGLGLAVVHGVVTQNGGRIAIESAVGVGTTFQILLPIITLESSESLADPVRLATRGTETVLLVEDEEAVRKITRIALQMQGYTVLEADGGAEAIRLSESYPGEIHLLVSDVVMPEMGGRQLLDAVRQRRPGLRVLFMSGYMDDAVLLHGVVESTDAFIQKPFTPLSLARKVREVINATPR